MSQSSGSEQVFRAIGLRLGQRRLALRLDALREVRPMPALARVPGARPWLVGVGSANGRLLPVTDLECFLTGRRAEGGEAQVVVVERDGHLLGLAVDEVVGVDRFELDADASPAPDDPLEHDCLRGQARAGGEHWQLIDVSRLLDDPGFHQAAADRAARAT